jgi:hypothetical protein
LRQHSAATPSFPQHRWLNGMTISANTGLSKLNVGAKSQRPIESIVEDRLERHAGHNRRQ